jgi:glycosyltransferase involved in cell wall biosynthesis
MRILIATQTYAPDANGQAVFTTRLAEGLARTGHDVAVLLPGNGLHSQQETRNRVTFYRVSAIPFRPWYPEVRLSIALPRKVTSVIRSFRPDLVHLQDHYSLAWMAFRSARRLGIPVIGTNHFLPENISSNLPIPAFAQGLATRLLWESWNFTYNHLDLLTTPTPTAAHILQEQHVRPEVLPVSCGINLSRFHQHPTLDRAARRREYGMAPDKPIFIFVGRVDREKRLDVLLHAVQQLPDLDFQVVIVGKGLHLKALRHLSRQLGVDDKVLFTGYLPAEDLPYALNSADIFVMPSEAELQSIATLEAMASGLPVLAANKHALPELVEDGRNGWLFPPGDAEALAQKMTDMLTHPERWPAMGEASRQTAMHHDLAESVDAYQRIYRQVLAAGDTAQQTAKPFLFYDHPTQP